MKFGETLERSIHPAFRNYYIGYKDLKQAIKIITGELIPSDEDISPLMELLFRRDRESIALGGIRRTPESQFQELLDYELNKINNFANVEYRVLLEEIRDLLYRLSALSASSSVINTRDAIENLKNEIIAFDGYIRMNFSGFRKALKKFDKCNSSNSSNWFLQRVVRSDFMLVPMDKLIHGIAVLEFKFRSGSARTPLSIHPNSLPVYADPARYRRLKFFIPPEELVAIEMEISGNMNPVFGRPLSVNSLGADELVDGFRTTIVAGRPGTSASGDISFLEHVTIFDNDAYDVYSLRRSKRPVTDKPLATEGYAESVFSVRWNQYQGKEGKCSIVRECHPRFTSAGARLHFLQLSQKNVTDLMDGKLTVESIVSSEGWNAIVGGFLDDFKHFIHQYKPSVVYSYRRSVFEKDGTVISVDKDIKLVDVRGTGEIFSVLPFQFHSILSQRVMTIWSDRNAIPSGLVDRLRGKPAVNEVTGFSKAIHAEAALHVVTEIERPVAAGLPNWFIHTINGLEGDKKGVIANMMVSVDDTAGDGGSYMSGGGVTSATPQPMGSPLGTGVFDIMPEKFASSQMLLHDIASAKEPKQQQTSAVPSRAPSTVLMPPPAASGPTLGNELDVPLLARSVTPPMQQPIKRHSLWEQVKFVFFGSPAGDDDLAEPLPISSRFQIKTFLANERTFLDWCHVAFVISAAAVALRAVNPNAAIPAALLTLVSLATITWSLDVYRMRAIALRNIKDLNSLMLSANGATTIALAVVLALTLTWYSQYQAFMVPTQ